MTKSNKFLGRIPRESDGETFPLLSAWVTEAGSLEESVTIRSTHNSPWDFMKYSQPYPYGTGIHDFKDSGQWTDEIVIDNFKLHSVSLTSEGYGVAGHIVSWHTEDRETDGHEAEARLDDGEVRSPEQ